MGQRILTITAAIALLIAFAAAVGADELSETGSDVPFTASAVSAAPVATPQVSKTAFMRD